MKIASAVGLSLLSTLSTCESLGPGCVPRFASGDEAAPDTDESSGTEVAGSDGSTAPQIGTEVLAETGGTSSTGEGTSTSEDTSTGEGTSTGETRGTSTYASDTSGWPPDTSTSGVNWDTSSSETDWDGSDTDYPQCGNGEVDGGEECDDGNQIHHDGCSNECHDNLNSGCSPNLPTVKCDPGLYCVAPGVCSGCTTLVESGSSCAVADPVRPACDPASEQCVECTPEDEQACDDSEPHCNKYTLECDGCLEHEQCETGVCLFYYTYSEYEGGCMPPETIAWVRQQSDCAAKDGSEDAPFCTITEALAAPQWSGGPIGIRVMHGTIPQPALPSISGRTVAVVGIPDEDGKFPRISDPATMTPMTSITGGELLLSRVRIDQSTKTAAAALCQQSSIVLNQVEIANNSGALDFSDCEFAVIRTLITGNTGGSRFSCMECGWNYMVNTFVTENDTGPSTPLLVLGDLNLEGYYVTIANNQGTLSSALACDTNPDQFVRFTNSAIFTHAQQPIECVNFAPQYTLEALFEDVKDQAFASYEDGIYRALPDSPILKGTYPYDAFIDYDGELRPNKSADNYVGADLP